MAYYGPRTQRDNHKRDSQRSRVYNAEGAVTLGEDLPTVPVMQAYTNKLLDSAWARRRWGRVQVTVEPGYGHRRATGGHGQVQMPTASRKERYLLHEIGHNLAGAAAWHDESFTRVVLELYTHVFGADAGKSFRAACRQERVKIGPPLKLRSPERTPKPILRRERKLFRVEIRRHGVTKHETLSHEATLVSTVLENLSRQLQGQDVAAIRIWRGRATTRLTARAASRRK